MNAMLDLWIVQDVFSYGSSGPGFTVHTSLQDAEREATERDAAVVPFRDCPTCGSVLGLESRPLQGGCNECR